MTARFIDSYKPKSRLHITPGLALYSLSPMPNRWWRFWQWLLLGWRWSKAE